MARRAAIVGQWEMSAMTETGITCRVRLPSLNGLLNIDAYAIIEWRNCTHQADDVVV